MGGAEGAAAARMLLSERGVLLAREAAARARVISLLRGLLMQEVRSAACSPRFRKELASKVGAVDRVGRVLRDAGAREDANARGTSACCAACCCRRRALWRA